MENMSFHLFFIFYFLEKTIPNNFLSCNYFIFYFLLKGMILSNLVCLSCFQIKSLCARIYLFNFLIICFFWIYIFTLAFWVFFFFFLRYDRNYNLNSHTRIFRNRQWNGYQIIFFYFIFMITLGVQTSVL